ncbi:MAG: hypothetical protein M0024_10680 [Nitrospiraceae bacterium]|nr:hypothetical protein [Nitrospiraceae bacterium]
MRTDDLRAIGRDLSARISLLRLSGEMKISTGTGAAGDTTFAIDRVAEDIILTALESLNEPLTVVSEEAGVLDIRGGGQRVVIDPIDGSKNAVSGIPFFCTSIAVASGDTVGDVVLGYVINLISGDEFWAEKGAGAWMNGERIFGQQGEDFTLVSFEAQHPGEDIQSILPVIKSSVKTRCLGATALDLACIAAGAASIFLSPSPSRSFDYAGGYLLVKEAGGTISDMAGRPIEPVRLGLERSRTLLAAGNERLHEKALGLLQKKG